MALTTEERTFLQRFAESQLEAPDPLTTTISELFRTAESLCSKIDWLIERNTTLENELAEAGLRIAELTAEGDALAKELSAAEQTLAAMDAGHEDYT